MDWSTLLPEEKIDEALAPGSESEVSDEPKDARAVQLLRMCEDAGVATFRSESDGGIYARFPNSGRFELAPLGSERFKSWLVSKYFTATNREARSNDLAGCLLLLQAGAWREPPRKLHVRIAGVDGKVYIDLCDEAHNVIEIDSDGWRVATGDDVWFLRSPSMLPLPEPQAGGSLAKLAPFVNCDEIDFVMLCGWLLSALNPSGPFPILGISSEQGSGKSTLTTLLSLLIDPSSAPRLSMPRSSDDLFVAAGNRHLLAIDNVTKLSESFSNDLCMLSTGAGISKRRLYTDNESATFTAKKPLVLNGIALNISRLDLLDRIYQVKLRSLKKRVLESELYRRFEEIRPRLLGALCSAVSAALRHADYTPVEALPRMADAACFVLRAEKGGGLPWKPGLFAEVVRRHEARKVEEAIAEDHVAQRLLEIGEGDGWSGTTRELLSLVLLGAEDGEKRFLPSTAKGLGRKLAELEPALRTSGLRIERRRTKRGWWVTLAENAG